MILFSVNHPKFVHKWFLRMIVYLTFLFYVYCDYFFISLVVSLFSWLLIWWLFIPKEKACFFLCDLAAVDLQMFVVIRFVTLSKHVSSCFMLQFQTNYDFKCCGNGYMLLFIDFFFFALYASLNSKYKFPVWYISLYDRSEQGSSKFCFL